MEKKQEVQQLPKVEVNVLRRKFAVTSVANGCEKNIGILRNQSGEVLYACESGSEEIQFLNKDNGQKMYSFSSGKVMVLLINQSRISHVFTSITMTLYLEDLDTKIPIIER